MKFRSWAVLVAMGVPLVCPRALGELETERASAGVERTLEGDAALRETHLGYLRHVLLLPEVAEIEREWWTLLSDPKAHAIAAWLDGALYGEPRVAATLHEHYDAIVRAGGKEDTLSAALDAFVQLDPGHRRLLAERMADHVEFLGGLRSGTGLAGPRTASLGFLPEGELRSMAERFLSSDLPSGNAPLGALPLLGAVGNLGRERRNAFVDYLAVHPESVTLWHRRNLVLAQDAHARSWILYWGRRVDRTEGLGLAYWQYLATLDADTLAQARADRDRPWPPKLAPPPLDSPLADPPGTPSSASSTQWSAENPAAPRPRVPELKRPEPPVAPKPPERPAGLVRPALPQRPIAPSPERGVRPE